MIDRWSEGDAPGAPRERRAYTARLLGAEPALVLHGGGNTSMKGTAADLFGDERPVLFMKASGRDLARATAADHVAVDLPRARRLLDLPADPYDEDDHALLRALRSCLLDPGDPHPSIETPVHAVIPGRFVDHTHADAVLALTNRPDGEAVVGEALGEEVIVVPYASPGLPLARSVARALAEAGAGDRPAGAMVWMRHGVTTWGETAEESYRRMIDLVSRAEGYLRRETPGDGRTAEAPEPPDARRLAAFATALRGALAAGTGDPDRPWRRVVLRSAADPETLGDLAALDRVRAETPPLTADHLVRTGARPLWLEIGAESDRGAGSGEEALRERIATDPLPRVVLVPGLGAFAAGADAREAGIALDVTRRTLRVKAHLAAAGAVYRGLPAEDLAKQESRALQAMKVARGAEPVLGRTVSLVTGAAGAIGAGVCRELLAAGAHVVATDLPGERLDALATELTQDDDPGLAGRVLATPLDVTDPASVAAAFDLAAAAWGGVDLLVVNAGAAHVASLEELDPGDFERLERVNVHGTLLLLSEGARRFRRQGTGGDVVLVSTKNVFAPGASFGAYSATKAAAHQLARVASQELAPLGVRVNMVAPDAVFSEGGRRSGLWAEVGPARMRARGLSEEGLEEHYRQRNLLRARISARHVGRAVVFFASRATPTTGATLPVDGGLPDATPR